jgi:hypothetical protein
MKLSKLKNTIREMIMNELTSYSGQEAIPSLQQDPNYQKSKDKESLIKTLKSGGNVNLQEDEALNEFAAFYKIKDDVDKEEAKAAIDKAIKDNPGQKNLQLALRILKDEEKVNFEKLANSLGIKSVATFNNQDSRKVLDGDLAPFISSARLKGSEPIEPGEPKEPKEPGRIGRPKGSTKPSDAKPSDALAYTMSGDVKVVGKDPSKSLIKRAVKAARSTQPVSAINTTDLDAVEAQLKAINSELETKLPKAKEIAAKGNIKNYSEEETVFMDDIRTKSNLRKQLIATRDKIVSKKVRR